MQTATETGALYSTDPNDNKTVELWARWTLRGAKQSVRRGAAAATCGGADSPLVAVRAGPAAGSTDRAAMSARAARPAAPPGGFELGGSPVVPRLLRQPPTPSTRCGGPIERAVWERMQSEANERRKSSHLAPAATVSSGRSRLLATCMV